MRLRHGAPVARATFDDSNLVSCAGLEPVMRLAESAGLLGIVAARVHLPGDKGSNPAGKLAAIVAGMIAGADSIDDLDVVRHGGMPMLFDEVYAPSTLGVFLREFSHGHVRQLQAASRELLARLARRVRLLPDAGQLTFVDVDSMLRRVYGKKKQGAGFGHTKVGGYDVRLRGLNPLIATLSTIDSAPAVAATRLRAGNAGSARGAASLVAEAIGVAGDCGAAARMDAKIRAACEGIAETQWVHIKYPQAVWDEDEGRWISDAQIAEIRYTAFEGTRYAITARLIVRRVKRLDHRQVVGQGELVPAWRYHAVFTDSPYILTQAEAHHRGHAVIEQVNADLIDGPLAHLPSGRFAANGAWLACAGIAHNLTRAAGHLAAGGYRAARAATIRTRIINVAARLAHRARTIHLHLPERWPWQHAWHNLFTAVHAPPT